MKIEIPLRTVNALNVREHWRARARRVKAEREAVLWHLGIAVGRKPRIPCVVTLTRIGPSRGLDPFDNLPASLKGAVDAFATWIGVDDRTSELVRYRCAQERGKEWLVRIEVTT